MEGRKFRSQEEFVDALVALIPRKELKKFEMNVFDRRLSLRWQFLAWCKINWRIPRYTEEKTKEMFLEILEKKNSKKWREFRFSALEDITVCWFDLVCGLDSKES